MTTWQDDARCRTVGIAVFFPDEDTTRGALTNAYRQARTICDHCTVRTPCLETALTLEGAAPASNRAGIWGGTTPTERADTARERAEANNPSDIHAPAIHDLTRAGLNRTDIGRRLGIDPRTVKRVLDRATTDQQEAAAA